MVPGIYKRSLDLSIAVYIVMVITR
jgi:hypothetical protein